LESGVFVNSSIVLICAVLASLAVGVLSAYGICMAMFNVFRIHARQVAVKSAKSAPGVVAPTHVVQS
jgi:ABC-type glycerol-3-phosphate transport system permease component